VADRLAGLVTNAQAIDWRGSRFLGGTIRNQHQSGGKWNAHL